MDGGTVPGVISTISGDSLKCQILDLDQIVINKLLYNLVYLAIRFLSFAVARIIWIPEKQ